MPAGRVSRAIGTISRLFVLAFALSTAPRTAFAQEAPDPVTARLIRELEDVRREGPVFQPSDYDGTQLAAAPSEIVAAGEEFVSAWREYRRAKALKVQLRSIDAPPKRIRDHQEEYSRALRALVEGASPPTPEDLLQFDSNSGGWCVVLSDPLPEAHHRAFLLACLRHKRYRAAVRSGMVPFYANSVRAVLLDAFGFDAEKVTVGEWLDGQEPIFLVNMAEAASDYTARMLLTWAELHWDDAVARHIPGQPFFPSRSGVHLPTIELMRLLDSSNRVSDQQKLRVASFLTQKGPELLGVESLLRSARPGGGKWLADLAQLGLNSEKNSVREAATKLLREAGHEVPPTNRLPDAWYRLWITPRVAFLKDTAELVVKFGKSVRTDLVSVDGQGLIKVDRDLLIGESPVVSAQICLQPTGAWPALPGQLEVFSPEEPWISASVPVPITFGHIANLQLSTVPLTFQVSHPRATAVNQRSLVSELQFDRAFDDSQPREEAPLYRFLGHQLILPRVQPGDYWFRVRGQGAALSPWQRIKVGAEPTRIDVMMEIGSTVTIPIVWPATATTRVDNRRSDSIPIYNPCLFVADGRPFELERNDSPYPLLLALSAQKQEDGRQITLSNLPKGKYRLTLPPSFTFFDRRTPFEGQPAFGWKEAQVTFEVSPSSSAEFVGPALKVEEQ